MSSSFPHLYPSAIDRHRLVGLLLRALRKNAPLTQTRLAALAGVSQATVSHLERLATEKPRSVRRRELLQVLFGGLKVHPRYGNVIAWLYDTVPLLEEESHRYDLKLRDDEFDAASYETLQSGLVDLLREVGPGKFQESSTKYRGMVCVVFEAQEHSRIQQDLALFEMEKLRGQRLLVTAFPSLLTRPDKLEFFKGAEWESTRGYKVFKKRWNLFEKSLEKYGERSIHCQDCIRQYASRAEMVDGLAYSQRREQIERWIFLLKKYPDYEVRFSQTTPDQEFEMKGLSSVMMRGRAHREQRDRHPRWGPDFVLWKSPSMVLSFLYTFEREWFRLSGTDHSKDKVIKTLEAWLINPPRFKTGTRSLLPLALATSATGSGLRHRGRRATCTSAGYPLRVAGRSEGAATPRIAASIAVTR